MPTFAPSKPVGRFHPRSEMVVLKRFMQMSPGQPVPKASASRKRIWWRRGCIAARDQVPAKVLKELDAIYAEKIAKTRAPISVEAVEEPDPVEPTTALRAEEGDKGWWKVSFDDGSEKKMRRADVETLGLIGGDDGQKV